MFIRAAATYALLSASAEAAPTPGMDLLPKPMARRMPPPLRRAVACGLAALDHAKVERPDGIYYATGLGCLLDTQEFLLEIERNAGGLLSPTAFMRSTHNTVPGLLALALKAQGPNLTFSQGFIGFHAALLNAMMHVEQHPMHSVLVGASDEHLPLLDHLYARLGGEARFGSAVRPAEGGAFFVVSGEQQESVFRIADVRIANVDLLETPSAYRTEAIQAGPTVDPARTNGSSYAERTGLHQSAPAVALAEGLEMLRTQNGIASLVLLDREEDLAGLIRAERC